MSVVQTLIEQVKKGADFSISFKNKNIIVNGNYLVRNGQYSGQYGFLPYRALPHIEELYHKYRYSMPSEKGDRLNEDGTRKKTYFQALDESELELCDEVLGENREVARAELESYVLGLILSNFPWEEQDELKGKWFWNSKKEPDLVLFREWFTGKSEFIGD